MYPDFIKWSFREDITDEELEEIFPWAFEMIFTIIDWHEMLHLLIRRESGAKGTYHVTDGCERFIEKTEVAVFDSLYPEFAGSWKV